MSLDDTDKAILNRIQSDFPIETCPFGVIARELNLKESEVLQRVLQLKQAGIIRRIGANFVPGKVGFVSTLCAARVPDDKIETFSRVVNRYPGVTHNYQRDDEFNVWFTFIARSREEIAQNLERIAKETGVETILNMPATKVFKIRAQFDL
ncbi:siroheme decarboxylase subunit alpha [Desulfatitalea tepidiphila]|uniref:siroheme decarboxylase subunit alpha n=1 Tax=Desulfatitalea tepidiphila TaxID=1185843 RepID=UPI0006B56965|nr:AsnC family transcriptional regulator [Desulfatitalea tepidiphila]